MKIFTIHEVNKDDRMRSRSRAFVRGVLSGLTPGNFFVNFDPPLYPRRDAQHRDLQRIGRDMYAAMEGFRIADQKTISKDETKAGE